MIKKLIFLFFVIYNIDYCFSKELKFNNIRNSYYINNIYIYGNKFLNKNKFLILLNNKFNNENFNNILNNLLKYKVFIRNIENIKSFYFNYGYFNFNIIKIIKKINYNGFLNIYLYINEGKRFKINNIIIFSNILKFNNILNKLKYNIYYKDKYFNYKLLKSLINKINFFFKKRGYINIIFNIKNIKLNNKIILYLYIKFGRIYYINKIFFKKNYIYKNFFLFKNIPQLKRFIYNKYLIEKGLFNLLKSNYFNKINKKINIDNIFINNLNIIYNLYFNNENLFNFNIGFNKNKNIDYKFIFSKKNILYIGNELNFKFIKNNYINLNNINFLYYLLKNIFIKYKFYYNKNLINNFINNIYSINNYGFNSSLIYDLNNIINYKFSLNYLYSYLYNLKNKLLIIKYLNLIDNKFNINNNYYNFNNFFIKNNLIINKLDNIITPNKGFLLNIKTIINFPFLNKFFYKYSILFKKYFYLDNKKIYNLNLNTFYSCIYSNNFDYFNTNFYKNFNFLNNNFLRGFDNKNLLFNYIKYSKIFNCKNKINHYCLSKIYLNYNSIFLFNTELNISNFLFKKKYLDYIKSYFFIDTGIIWNNKINNFFLNNYKKNILNNINIKNISRISFGVIFKIFTPIGFLNLIYGYPIKKNINDKINIFNFYLGNS